MSKKIIAILVTALVFAFAGSSVFAGDVTTAYLELGGTSNFSIIGGTTRARLTLLDAAGVLATTIGGSPISEAIVEIESVNYSSTVGFADLKATAATTSVTYATGVYKPSLTDDSIEFGINYPGYPTILPLGIDIIKVSVKKGTSIVVSQQANISVIAPTANCYVIRTGGIGTLPNVLDEMPAPQNDKGALRPAGDSVAIDVFSAYGRDTDADTFYDKFFFTKTIPVGADTVSVSGLSSPGNASIISASGVALVDGHAALTQQVKDLKIPAVLNGSGAANTAAVKTILDNINLNGLLIVFRVTSTVTRAIGGSAVDVIDLVTGDGPLRIFRDQRLGYNGLSQTPVTSAPITSAPLSYRDTCKFQPATFNKLSVVALPVNAITATAGIYNYFGTDPTETSPMDAFNLVINPAQPKPTGNKYTTRGNGGYCIGAILGWDSYGNPAPFKAGTAVGFKFVGSVTQASSTWADTGVTGVLTATAYSPFLAFQVADPTGAGVKVSVDATYGGTPSVVKTALSIIDDPSKGVTYAVKNDKQLGYDLVGPTAVGFTATGTIDGGTVADLGVDITANGFNGDALALRALVQSSGTKIKLGPEKTASPLDSVTITQDSRNVNLAKETITLFTSIDAAGALQNKITTIVETGNAVTFQPFAPTAAPWGTLTIGTRAADPGDFPPTGVIAAISTAGVSQDSGKGHDEIDIQNIAGPPPKLSVIILDAFGNSYGGGTTGAPLSTLEDADPIVKVFKEDGTTAFPGATGDVDLNNIIANIDPKNVAPDAQKAIVNIAAGAASGNVTLNLKALQQTILKNLYVPIAKLDTPVKLNFGDQNGVLIAPVYKNATTVGSFTVDQEIKDGVFTSTVANPATITSLVSSITYNVKPSAGKTALTIAADGGDADATNTTLTLTYAPIDTVPPVIGAVTAGSCSISVAFTDNVALNLAGSTVKVLNSSGTDITSQLPAPTITGDKTPSGSITFTGTPIGLYTLDIAVKDTSGNTATEQRPANVTTCATGSCKSVEPTFAVVGTEKKIDVTITGENTNFSSASTVAFSCAGITVDSVNATSATTIVASITIAADAAVGKCDVTVTTGLEVVTCAQAFELTSEIILPTCVSVSPSTVNAGDTTDVTITLADIDLTKVAGPLSVSFGCTGVTVTSTTVNVISATQAKVTIAVAETAQDCTGDVTITGAASVGVVCKNVFTVKAKVVPPECLINTSPSPIRNGFILPRIRRITLTGVNSNWTSSSTVTIAGINTIIPLSRSKSEIVVLAIIPSKIRLAAGDKAVTVTTGTEVCTGKLTIQ